RSRKLTKQQNGHDDARKRRQRFQSAEQSGQNLSIQSESRPTIVTVGTGKRSRLGRRHRTAFLGEENCYRRELFSLRPVEFDRLQRSLRNAEPGQSPNARSRVRAAGAAIR